jgi:Proto-chlorophyllide reductase 57 kD subunit
LLAQKRILRDLLSIEYNPKQLGKYSMQWTPEAEAKLKEIPFFVRPAARKKIEKLAVEMGATEITATIYDEAKKKFGNN